MNGSKPPFSVPMRIPIQFMWIFFCVPKEPLETSNNPKHSSIFCANVAYKTRQRNVTHSNSHQNHVPNIPGPSLHCETLPWVRSGYSDHKQAYKNNAQSSWLAFGKAASVHKKTQTVHALSKQIKTNICKQSSAIWGVLGVLN